MSPMLRRRTVGKGLGDLAIDRQLGVSIPDFIMPTDMDGETATRRACAAELAKAAGPAALPGERQFAPR